MSRLATMTWCVCTLALLGWLALGCTGTLQTGDDDDAADDDAADDDVADDDDAADDDDVADDDATDDDDAADDDDDDSMPTTPGIRFDVMNGQYTGHYDYTSEVYCGEYEGELVLVGFQDQWYSEGFEIGVPNPPGPNDHVDDGLFMVFWDDQQLWAVAYGGPQCFLDTIDGWPVVTGTFECAGLHTQTGAADIAVVNGTVVCP